MQHSKHKPNKLSRAIPVLLVTVFISIAVWAFDPFLKTAPKGRSESIETEPLANVYSTQKLPAEALGMASCSATACHGENDSSTLIDSKKSSRWRSSATHWVASDPHTKAYQALTGPRAKAIMQRLRGFDLSAWPRSAEWESRCLSCHTNPSLASSGTKNDPVLLAQRAEGVGCESCHGNASLWLDKHFTWTGDIRESEYEKYGMNRLYDLGKRAMLCSRCHLGAPENKAQGFPLRDMNHDMIAAGHPRLNFELAEFQRRLRPHWVEKDRHREPSALIGPEFEARLWLIGRIANAEAACQLLADRASRIERDSDGVWPDYAELSCFSCHHELLPSGWKQAQTSRPGTKAGSRRWQTIWPLTRLESLEPLGKNTTLKSPLTTAFKDLESVRKLIEEPKGCRPIAVEHRAKIASDSLKQLRSVLASLSDREVTLLTLELYREISLESLNWDEACQLVQGLATLERIRLHSPSGDEKSENPAFEPTFNMLLISKTQSGMKLQSPKGFDPGAFSIELEKLLHTVPKDCKGALK